MKPRRLRIFRRCAQIEHFCDRCFQPIFPGQIYEADISVTSRGRLLILKNHVEPLCEYPDPPEDEEDREEEGWDDMGLPLAA